MHRSYEARSGSGSPDHSNSSAFSPNANPNEDWTKLPQERTFASSVSLLDNLPTSYHFYGIPQCSANTDNALFETTTQLDMDQTAWRSQPGIAEDDLINMETSEAHQWLSSDTAAGSDATSHDFPIASAEKQMPEGMENKKQKINRSGRDYSCGTLTFQPRPGPFECGWHNCKHVGSFSRQATLWRHIKSKHLDPESYTCMICSYKTGRKDKFQDHVRFAHSRNCTCHVG